MKYQIAISFCLVFSILSVKGQNSVVIKPLEMSVKASDIGRINEETRIAFSIHGLEKEFLRVKAFDFTVKDGQGTNLVKKGKEKLKEFESKGFFSSQPVGWSYFDYDFYNRKDALGARFITYCLPSKDSPVILLNGVMHIAVKKSDRPQRATLENIKLEPGQEYALADGTVRFLAKGTMNVGDKNYKNYRVETDLPVASTGVSGQKPFEGLYVAPDEFYVEAGTEQVTLVFELTDSEIVEVPVNLEFGVGL